MRIQSKVGGYGPSRSETKLGFAIVFAAGLLCVPPAVASDTVGTSAVHALATLNGAFTADIDGLHAADAAPPLAISGSVADFTSLDFKSLDFASHDAQAQAGA